MGKSLEMNNTATIVKETQGKGLQPKVKEITHKEEWKDT